MCGSWDTSRSGSTRSTAAPPPQGQSVPHIADIGSRLVSVLSLSAARVTFLVETFHLIRFHPRSAIWAAGARRACGRRKNHRFDSQAATSALRARRRRESPRAGRIDLEVSCSSPDSRSNLSRIGLRQFRNWPLQQDMLGRGSTYPSARTLASTPSACAASSTRDRSAAGPCPPPRPLWLYGNLASPYGRRAANCLE